MKLEKASQKTRVVLRREGGMAVVLGKNQAETGETIRNNDRNPKTQNLMVVLRLEVSHPKKLKWRDNIGILGENLERGR